MEKASEFDQSGLFKKIYEAEYGIFGGEPYGVLIGDYEFSNHPEDMALLEASEVAAAAHAPFISAADPELFGLDSFTDIDAKRDLAKIFDSVEYAKWKSFRESEDSRYVGLCLPHTLMRLPYGDKTQPTEGFRYEEDVDGRDHKKYLWGNAAYAMGAALPIRSQSAAGCIDPRRARGGPRGRAANTYLSHRRRRFGPQVPDGSGDYRSPRKGVQRFGIHSASPLQKYRFRRILCDAVG